MFRFDFVFLFPSGMGLMPISLNFLRNHPSS